MPASLGAQWPTRIELRGQARDLVVDDSGLAHEAARAATEVVVDGVPPVVVSISADPPVDAVAQLVGAPARRGWRTRLAALPGVRAHPLSAMLLDEVPGAYVISGYRVLSERPELLSRDHAFSTPDLCSGWRRDGVMYSAIERTGAIPELVGVPIRYPTGVDENAGWLDLEPARPASMRRLRRIDVGDRDGEDRRCSAWFRDVHVRPDGAVLVLHEYDLHAVIGGPDAVIRDIRATARVLPWRECPLAAESVRRVIGVPLDRLDDTVRMQLVGVPSCTHLNDLLRSLIGLIHRDGADD